MVECLLFVVDCSGVHRSLGTHITKGTSCGWAGSGLKRIVRSLFLDHACYTPEVVRIFESLGNEKINSIYEFLLGSIPFAPTKPTALDSHEVRIAFIQAKYAEYLFVSTSYSSESVALRRSEASNDHILVQLDPTQKQKLSQALSTGDLLSLLHTQLILHKNARSHFSFPEMIRAYRQLLEELGAFVGQMEGATVEGGDDGIVRSSTIRFLELNGLSLDSQ